MAISRVGAASAATTSLTVPAHAVGDLMLMLAWRSGSSSAPTVPSGWTVLGTANQTGSTKCWVGLYYHVATSTSDTSGTWTSATGLVCMIYRQAAVPVAGDVSVQAGASTTANYPAKTISDTVNSWFAALVGKGGGTGTISGLTKETSTSTTEEGWDSNAVRSTNWPSTNQTVTSPWGTATIEIRRSFDVLTPTIAGTASLSPTVAALNAFSATVAGTSSLSAPLAPMTTPVAVTVAGTSSLAATLSKFQAGVAVKQDPERLMPRFSGPPKLANVALRLRLAQEQRAAPGPAPTVFRPVNASIAGTSSLSATLTALHRLSASVSGTSSLSASVIKTIPPLVTTQDAERPSPRFTGPPKLANVALRLRLAQEQRALPGVVPTVFRPVNASIAGTSSFAPTVRELHRITVTIAGTSSFSATLRELHRFAATIAGTSTLAATATELHRFTVTIAGTSSFASSLKALHLFTATIAGAGSLSAGTRLLRRFSATVAGTSSLSASLVELHRIAPSVAGTSSLTATVTKYHRFSASLAGIGSLSATLTALHRLSASIQGSSNLTAQVSKQRTLDPERPMPRFTGPPKLRNVPLRLRLAQQQLAAGSRPFGAIGVAINGTSSMAPTVRELHRITATVAGHGTFTATLTPLRRFTTSLAGSSSLSAAVSALHRLSATLAGTSNVSATVASEHRLALAVAGRSSLASAISELHRFSLGIAGDSSVTALIVLHPVVGIAGTSSLTAAVQAISGVRNPLPFDRPSDDARTGVIHREGGVGASNDANNPGTIHRGTDFDRPVGTPSS